MTALAPRHDCVETDCDSLATRVHRVIRDTTDTFFRDVFGHTIRGRGLTRLAPPGSRLLRGVRPTATTERNCCWRHASESQAALQDPAAARRAAALISLSFISRRPPVLLCRRPCPGKRSFRNSSGSGSHLGRGRRQQARCCRGIGPTPTTTQIRLQEAGDKHPPPLNRRNGWLRLFSYSTDTHRMMRLLLRCSVALTSLPPTTSGGGAPAATRAYFPPLESQSSPAEGGFPRALPLQPKQQESPRPPQGGLQHPPEERPRAQSRVRSSRMSPGDGRSRPFSLSCWPWPCTGAGPSARWGPPPAAAAAACPAAPGRDGSR